MEEQLAGPVDDGSPEREPAESVQVSNGSLGGRMARRAEELEKHQTEWFGVPGYEDLVEVELRALAWATMRKAQERNERVRDVPTRELYNMADQLATATLGFREIVDAAEASYRDLDDDWVRLAQRASTVERPAPEPLTPRKAILWLVGDKRLPFLVQEWGQWAATIRKGVDEEVVRDFSTTGSPS